ncbi:class I SAM-dependent methyltransferase [Halobacillus salinus]|uniref:class I SAM-dependent methyltransferase n=1 Tax=Halobacillus salinus TaxID=192814 RepID=UPI0009A7DCBC|nr:class I SAM-dependent methyltransferase [Halobacillus salinus]
MQGNKGLWEQRYAKEDDTLWGLKPVGTLVDYESLVDSNGRVLDLGMGEGRNGLYFAAKGFEAEGIDISETAVDRSLVYAEEYGLAIKTEVNDLISCEIEENAYSLIILANVLNFFRDDEIEHILDKAKKGLIEGGLLYIQAFDRNDPGFEVNRQKSQQVTESTFYRPRSDSYVHFFTKNELESHFEGYQTIRASETYLLDVSHGEPHYHSTIEMFVRK